LIAIGVKQKDGGKYELSNQVLPNEDCILITDRTNFYPESGGQISDTGYISNATKSVMFKVENVVHLQGFTFHSGRLVGDTTSASISLNDSVVCSINKSKRFETSLNHTGVHLLNHAIRKHFNSENSIIQTNSVVNDTHLKFEFKFNEMLHKPSIEDLESIQKICMDLIRKSIPVYMNDGVIVDDDEISKSTYPVRKLNDVIYPSKLRVVSLGKKWDEFIE
jgi:alanyl-tRNA synthetase